MTTLEQFEHVQLDKNVLELGVIFCIVYILCCFKILTSLKQVKIISKYWQFVSLVKENDLIKWRFMIICHEPLQGS